MNNLVIAGAYYFDRDSNTLLRPHYTGEYTIVDCDKFITMEELKSKYDDSYINQVKDNPIEFEGKQYFDAEYSPWAVDNWELLSDLSELYHLEENFDW